ncbi:MAG TPA: putative toxin-antitoxin system toxin component, PIN family [Gaiellaceae bacterium]|nr:putative toxin-antitoxin system toxin component, PIN family [Gaiellaceae bacterium]
MRRIVVDPGVLVSAIITPNGPPAEIVRAVREERARLVVCPHLLAELLGVLQREKFRGYVTIDEAEQYVAGLASIAEARPDPAVEAPISRDPKDDYLIALTRESSADALVSGDADLLVLEDNKPPVVSPATFVEGLEPESM